MAKSYIRTERKLCMVCRKRYPTGGLLITRNAMIKPPDDWGLCPRHQMLKNQNFVALVEVDHAQSIVADDMHMLPEDAVRTGVVVHMRRDVFQQFFHDEPPDSGVAYVSAEVIALLQRFKLKLQGRGDH